MVGQGVEFVLAVRVAFPTPTPPHQGHALCPSGCQHKQAAARTHPDPGQLHEALNIPKDGSVTVREKLDHWLQARGCNVVEKPVRRHGNRKGRHTDVLISLANTHKGKGGVLDYGEGLNVMATDSAK